MNEIDENDIIFDPKRSFQGLIFSLQKYWASKGCVILNSYDMPMGAGTFHPATTLRALGTKAWKAAYVQPCRRPTDGRYGENPNRLQHYYQFQVILKPSPENIQNLYIDSLKAIGIDTKYHDIRFVEDDWESPTLGAKGLGWECWCDGMEVSQFTYFQQVCGILCKPVCGEITYGLERLAMYIQDVENVYDLIYSPSINNTKAIKYGNLFLRAEQEYSRYNFEYADKDFLFDQFEYLSKECEQILSNNSETSLCVLPAYDYCIQASHIFNLLDARGAISIDARQDYILRIRNLAVQCGEDYLKAQKDENLEEN